jgi:Vitamin K-dependent gamma-carboxylase
VKRLDRALFGPESPARLWWTHTALAALIALRIVAGPYRQLDPTPDGLFRPVWFLWWLPSMPDAAAILAIQVIGGAAVVAFVFRRWPRASFAVAWVAYLVLAGLRDSRGKILHNDVLLLLATVPFLVAPLAVDRRERTPDARCGWPIGTGIAVVALGYFFAGYWKLVRSGLDWVTSDNVRLSVAWGPKPAVGRWDWLADVVTSTSWFGKVIAAVTLAFELSFPIVLFVRRARIAYVVIATTLHISTYFLFGLDYWAWIGLLWILFVDWPAVVRGDREDHRPDRTRVIPSADRVAPVARSSADERDQTRDQKGLRWRSTSS